MLKAKTLPKLLEQAVGNGTVGAMLLNSEGSLLACAGDKKQSTVVGAISSSVFASYSSLTSNESMLDCMLIENENGRVVITRISKLLLVIYSDNTVPFGLLKQKSDALKTTMEPEFNKIM